MHRQMLQGKFKGQETVCLGCCKIGTVCKRKSEKEFRKEIDKWVIQGLNDHYKDFCFYIGKKQNLFKIQYVISYQHYVNKEARRVEDHLKIYLHVKESSDSNSHNNEGKEKWPDFQDILHIKSTRFLDRLDVHKEGKSRTDETVAQATGRKHLHFSMMREISGENRSED